MSARAPAGAQFSRRPDHAPAATAAAAVAGDLVRIVRRISYRSWYSAGTTLEYWNGRAWTVVKRFAKLYRANEATRIVCRRFHDDDAVRLQDWRK